jgi:hypothetical protein
MASSKALARTASQPDVPSPGSPVLPPYRYSTSFSAERATLAKVLRQTMASP